MGFTRLREGGSGGGTPGKGRQALREPGRFEGAQPELQRGGGGKELAGKERGAAEGAVHRQAEAGVGLGSASRGRGRRGFGARGLDVQQARRPRPGPGEDRDTRRCPWDVGHGDRRQDGYDHDQAQTPPWSSHGTLIKSDGISPVNDGHQAPLRAPAPGAGTAEGEGIGSGSPSTSASTDRGRSSRSRAGRSTRSPTRAKTIVSPISRPK